MSSVWQLIKSDYRAHYAYKRESQRRVRVLFIPRLLTNASMHASVLVRLQTECSAWTAWLWRRLLITCHGIDVPRGVQIGPGLQLCHPVGIVIGAKTVIGARVTIHQNVTISPARGRSFPQEPLIVHDDAIFFPGSCALGPISVGKGAVVGALQLLTKDLPAGSCYSRGRVRTLDNGEHADASPPTAWRT